MTLFLCKSSWDPYVVLYKGKTPSRCSKCKLFVSRSFVIVRPITIITFAERELQSPIKTIHKTPVNYWYENSKPHPSEASDARERGVGVRTGGPCTAHVCTWRTKRTGRIVPWDPPLEPVPRVLGRVPLPPAPRGVLLENNPVSSPVIPVCQGRDSPRVQCRRRGERSDLPNKTSLNTQDPKRFTKINKFKEHFWGIADTHGETGRQGIYRYKCPTTVTQKCVK